MRILTAPECCDAHSPRGERLALDGGEPVRAALLPYTRHDVDEADVAAVTQALRSGWLTTGPEVAAFEEELAAATGARHAVAVSNGTAALDAMLHAVEVGPGDEVIVPALSFVATANAACYRGARPVFVDVEPDTLLVDPAAVAAAINPRTRAIVAVDYAGQPCRYAELRRIADRHGVVLLSDSCHALGATLDGQPLGSFAHAAALSFHPAKHVAAGEGGAVVTNCRATAERVRRYRNHGIAPPDDTQAADQPWRYDVAELARNARMCELSAALARVQLTKLHSRLARLHELAERYDAACAARPWLRPLATRPEVGHARHLYVARWRWPGPGRRTANRDFALRALRAEGIGVQVHYLPIHLLTYYRERFGTRPGLCPAAESAASEILSLPLFSAMSHRDLQDVIAALDKVAAMLGGID